MKSTSTTVRGTQAGRMFHIVDALRTINNAPVTDIVRELFMLARSLFNIPAAIPIVPHNMHATPRTKHIIFISGMYPGLFISILSILAQDTPPPLQAAGEMCFPITEKISFICYKENAHPAPPFRYETRTPPPGCLIAVAFFKDTLFPSSRTALNRACRKKRRAGLFPFLYRPPPQNVPVFKLRVVDLF